MVIDVLIEAESHMTVEDLHRRVQVRHPDISESSIYRTMELLGDHGIVDHVHLGHGPARFHLTGDPHAHLVCNDCGQIEELDRTVAATFAHDVSRAGGFVVNLGHFALTGRCRACAAASDKMQA